jgi:hypothetical protein
MYKVSYYLNGGTTVKFKSFETLFEATLFSNSHPINTVIEIKYYDPVEHRKPDRN